MIDDGDALQDGGGVRPFLAALRPAMPAVIGAAALTFLFTAFVPMSWIAAISWNLYLDRVFELFVPPVDNAARLALAFGMSALAALLAAFFALLASEPGIALFSPLRRPRSHGDDDVDADLVAPLPRRRADRHPDDPPRPPILAGRDLPAGGLGPVLPMTDAAKYDGLPFVDAVIEDDDELVLADLAPVEPDDPAEAPWLQPARVSGPPMPDPADHSLGAMVQRLEAGLLRRRQETVAQPPLSIPGMAAANEDEDSEIDFALEAALGTLQRLNRNSVG